MDVFGLYHENGWIDKHKPLWWDIDYSPDPRELIPSEEFMERMETISFRTWAGTDAEVHFYCGEQVPITLIETEIKSGRQLKLFGPNPKEKVTLFATARPYNKNEIGVLCRYSKQLNLARVLMGLPQFGFDDLWPLENLKEFAEKWGLIPFNIHFIPHVRGLLKERRKNQVFWYPVLSRELAFFIEKNTDKERVPYVWVYNIENYYTENGCNWYVKVGAESISKESPSHPSPYLELKQKGLISWRKAFKLQTSDLEEVAYDEFMEGLDGDSHMISVYPVRHPDLEETISLVLSTRTHPESKRRGPIVLGIMGNDSYRKEYSIWRLKNSDLCCDISKILEEHLGESFDVVYFDGGKYRLIGSKSGH